MKRIHLAAPAVNGREMAYVRAAFESNWLAPAGANLPAFEGRVAALCGRKEGVALASGTAALHLSLRLAGVDNGDVVFCSALTFVASANPILYLGARPVFLDSAPGDWNLSPDALWRAFQQYRPKAVVAVDLYGTPARLFEIEELCKQYGAALVEDAAEALGSELEGRPAGSFGESAALSFNGNKIVTTAGGGMLLTNDPERAQKARFWAAQAKEPAKHYQHRELGYNYRLSNVLAGIGLGQLETLGEFLEKKRRIRQVYEREFAGLPGVSLNPLPPNTRPNCWLTCLRIDPKTGVRPETVLRALEEENIESRPVWKPMQLQPLYTGAPFFAHEEGKTPVSSALYAQGLCLPGDIRCTAEDLARVVKAVKGCFGKERAGG